MNKEIFRKKLKNIKEQLDIILLEAKDEDPDFFQDYEVETPSTYQEDIKNFEVKWLKIWSNVIDIKKISKKLLPKDSEQQNLVKQFITKLADSNGDIKSIYHVFSNERFPWRWETTGRLLRELKLTHSIVNLKSMKKALNSSKWEIEKKIDDLLVIKHGKEDAEIKKLKKQQNMLKNRWNNVNKLVNKLTDMNRKLEDSRFEAGDKYSKEYQIGLAKNEILDIYSQEFLVIGLIFLFLSAMIFLLIYIPQLIKDVHSKLSGLSGIQWLVAFIALVFKSAISTIIKHKFDTGVSILFLVIGIYCLHYSFNSFELENLLKNSDILKEK